MNYSIPFYLRCLKELPRCKASYYKDESKTYSNMRKSLCFYDKVLEHNKKNKTMDLVDKTLNILRYELKIKKISKVYKKTIVKDLYLESTLNDLYNIWVKEYNRIIKKKKCIDLSRLVINKPNDVLKFFAYLKIQELEEDELNLIMDMSKQGLKLSSYHYLKNKMDKPGDDILYTTKYLDELNSKINKYTILILKENEETEKIFD